MELRRCSHEHFIQTLRGGSVIKVLNTNHLGRSALSFKLLNDVCKRIDIKAPRQDPTMSSCFTYTDLRADRTLREVKAEPDEFVSDSVVLESDVHDTTTLRQLKDRFLKRKRKSVHIDGHVNLVCGEVGATIMEIKSEKDESDRHTDNGLDSDLDDDTTLKQLKRIFLRKNKKCSIREEHPTLLHSNENLLENESNLNKPIIHLTLKNLERTKAERKCMIGSGSSSSTTIINTKIGQNLVCEDFQHICSDLIPIIPIKVEDDAMELESQKETSISGEPSFCTDEVPCTGGEVPSETHHTKVHPETRESLSSIDGLQICVINEMSYDHLDDIEHISTSVPSDGMNDTLENIELLCHEVLDEIPEQNINSCLQNIKMVQYHDKYKSGLPHEQDYSLNSPDKTCSPSRISVNSSKADDTFVQVASMEEQHTVTCTLDGQTENGSTCRFRMDDLLDERQASESLITFEEFRSSPKNQSLDCVDTDAKIETHRHPERLLSTRKAISPSSQEQLCSAMKSDDLCSDACPYIGSEHKGKLHEMESVRKDSFARSDIPHPKRAVNRIGNGQVSQRKIYVTSRNILKKSLIAKVNLEGPRFSRVLPNLSTECTSIEACSKSAITFSLRQMQDMESLASKLIDELDSMKSIVEQKLLFEAYRNVSLKADADEVKSAISSASKMEVTARKWLSTMARDCKRFCKIMKMTPNSSPGSTDSATRERRKIVFADEAGGKLCQVRYFEADAIATHSCM